MPVKLRLQRKGRRKAPYYHIVAADARSPRDGKFIERLGFYNPMTKPATIEIDRDSALDWINKGAQPTDTVRAILRFKGVLYKKHLLRGVKKGAMTMEQVEEKVNAWIEAKESKVAERRAETAKEKEAERVAIFGKPKEEPVEETPVAESAEVTESDEAATTEEVSTEAAPEAANEATETSETPETPEAAEEKTEPAAETKEETAGEAEASEAPEEDTTEEKKD